MAQSSDERLRAMFTQAQIGAFSQWLTDIVFADGASRPCPLCRLSHAEHCVTLSDGHSSFAGCPPLRHIGAPDEPAR